MAATLGEDVGVTGVRLCSSWCGPVTGERSGTGLCAGGRVAREHTSTPETMTLRQRAQRADRPAHRNGLTMLGIRLAEGPTGPSVTALDTPDGATALEVAFTAASRRWPRPPAPGTSLRSALGWWRGRGWLLTDPTAGWARLSYRRAAELFERATTPLATAAGQSTEWPLHQLRHSALTHDAESGTAVKNLLSRRANRLATFASPNCPALQQLAHRVGRVVHGAADVEFHLRFGGRPRELPARVAVAVVFFVSGAVFASWASRVPAIRGGLAHGQLGLAMAGLAAGALPGASVGRSPGRAMGQRAHHPRQPGGIRCCVGGAA